MWGGASSEIAVWHAGGEWCQCLRVWPSNCRGYSGGTELNVQEGRAGTVTDVERRHRDSAERLLFKDHRERASLHNAPEDRAVVHAPA